MPNSNTDITVIQIIQILYSGHKNPSNSASQVPKTFLFASKGFLVGWKCFHSNTYLWPQTKFVNLLVIKTGICSAIKKFKQKRNVKNLNRLRNECSWERTLHFQFAVGRSNSQMMHCVTFLSNSISTFSNDEKVFLVCWDHNHCTASLHHNKIYLIHQS